MSKFQEGMHRFIVDVTIVTGCVCLVLTTRGVLNTFGRVNTTIDQLQNVTIPQINSTVKEARGLIAQLNGNGVVEGSTAYKLNITIDNANKIMAQLCGNGDVADSFVHMLENTIEQINKTLAQMNGTGIADAGVLKELNDTIKELQKLTKQGRILITQINEGGTIQNVNKVIDSAKEVMEQLNGKSDGADGVANKLGTTLEQINGILGQIKGNGEDEPSTVKQLNDTIKELQKLTKQGTELVAQINEGGTVRKINRVLDGGNVLIDQLGDKMERLGQGDIDRLCACVNGMLKCYSKCNKKTNGDINDKLFGKDTDNEFFFMDNAAGMLDFASSKEKKTFYTSPDMIVKIRTELDMAEIYIGPYKDGTVPEDMEEFAKQFKDLNKLLHDIVDNASVSDGDSSPAVNQLVKNVKDILAGFKGRSLASILAFAPAQKK